MLAAFFASLAHGQDPPEDEKLTATITSLPEIPRAIHDAMQSRQYGEAVKLIETELGKNTSSAPDYLLYLQGVAHTEAKEFDAATAAFKKLEQSYPKSDWVSRSRFGRANVLVLQRQYIEAGEIYQKEAERLLSRDRKDDLAKIYLDFADRYYEGIPAADPSEAKKPDYKQALTYYSEANKLGPTPLLRQKTEFRIARCYEELKQRDKAIAAYKDFLQKYAAQEKSRPEESKPFAPATMQAESKFRLGLTQLNAGQKAVARKTWQDFLADWEGQAADAGTEGAEKINAFLARAEYRIPHTYGLPAPATVGDLELAVTAAEKFLKNHPKHELAPKTELEIAQGLSRHRRHANAVERLKALIANGTYSESEQIPVARQMLGQEYLAQSSFEDAISAWKEFLDKHPTDPKWPEVQKRIVDTEYAKAQQARLDKKYAAAREAWQTFLNKYPLDPRAPRVLMQFGQMKFAEASEQHKERIEAALEQGDSAQSVQLNDDCKKLFEEAIVDWRRVVTKYPGHVEASQASYMIGITLEDKLDRLKEAIESYEKVKGQFADRAKKRITRLTSPQLMLATERKFRSDEKPRIKLTTRNLEKVTVKVYRVDMVDYFRKMHLASGLETLDIALIDPDEQFEHQVDGYVEFQRMDQDIELPIDGPGVSAVTVSSDKQEATTMVVVSDLDMIVKTSRNEMFLFVENMRTGKPVEGVSVLVSNGSEVFAEAITGKDGVFQQEFDELKAVRDLRVFAVQEGHMASTVNNLNGLDFAVGLTPRGYLYTDRPAYRKGQLVNIKGIVRWVDQDRFTFQPNEKFKLDVYDSRGRQLDSRDVALNAFGTINSNVILPSSAPQGNYRIHLHRSETGPNDSAGALSFETQFRVTEYKLEPIQVDAEFEKSVYYRGEKVKGTISLKYYYGTPLANESIEYRFGRKGELVKAKTNDKGEVKIELATQRFSESQPLKLIVNYPERGLKAEKTVFLATRGFAITASTMREVFINGETFETMFRVADPAGKAVETDLKVEVYKMTSVRGKVGEKLIEEHGVKTDDEDGIAKQVLSLAEGGIYFIRAIGTDQFGNEVSGQTQVRVSGDKDTTRLRILADQFSFNVGDEAKVNLHWREQPALALVTFEGATVLKYQLVNLKNGDNEIQLPMESAFAPNFFLSVAVMQRNRFHAAQSQFRVAQKLNVVIKPNRNELKPGDDLSVEIQVTDPQGNPVKAELSLALIQTNLLNMFSDVQGAVNTFFGSGNRRNSVRQSTSCTFSYKPKTRGVSQFLLAETERRETLEREVRALAELNAPAVAGDFAVGPVGGGAMPSSGLDVDNDNDGLSESDYLFDMDFEASNSAVAANGVMMDDLFGNDMQVQQQVQRQSRIVNVTRMRTETRTRTIPVQKFRTEIRDGKQIQVPYTEQVAQTYSVQVPYTEQVEQSYTVQVPQAGAKYSVQIPSFHTPSFGRGEEHNLEQQSVDVSGAIRGQLQNRSQSRRYVDVAGPGPGNVQSILSSFALNELSLQQRQFDFEQTINGFTKGGKFLTVNGRDKDQMRQFIRDGGQILPAMAHAETAFWDPTIVTDDTGKALVTITMPSRSTAWRIRAKGVNNKTLAGEASSDVITKKDLFGDMKLPLAFSVGDEVRIPVDIHNSLEGARGIEVKLKVTLGDKSTEQTKSVDVQGPGISEVVFPITIEEAEQAIFELTVSNGNDISDTSAQSVAVRPFGFPVFETASGTSSQSTLAMIDFNEKLNPSGRSLEIVIGSDVNRTLLESITGAQYWPTISCRLPTSSPIERATSDVLGGTALLKMIGSARDADTPEAQAITGRITSSVSHLISSQRDKGGWSWTGNANSGEPDPLLSARVMWALSVARDSGFAVSQKQFDQGKAYLKTSFASSAQSDLERQTIVLHAMAVSGCGDFSFANRLYRERNRLSVSGLTHLALTLVAMKHKEMAADLIPMIKVPTENKAIAVAARKQILPWMRNRVELQAMYLLALQEITPVHPHVPLLSKTLMAARVGSRWPVEKSNGPAIRALAARNKAEKRSEKFKLTIAVNDQAVKTLTIDPSVDGSQRVEVPVGLLRDDRPQRIEFELDGRATFSYSAMLSGFVAADKITRTTRDWSVSRRYEPSNRMFDGRSVPRGFGVVNGSYRSFTNPLTQLAVGDRAKVTVSPRRHQTTGRIGEQYDYLVLTEPIPAGCTVLDGSVKGAFERYEIEPGQIVFHIGNRRYPNDIHYTLVGYVPGKYRAPQSILRSFYEPSLFSVSKIKELDVLDAGAESKDEYRLTPDELYYLGDKEFAKGNFDAAHKHLSELYNTWRLDADKNKNVVRWLFATSLAKDNHGDSVKYFEVLKEKFPDVEITFEEILQVAKSYRELGEYERSYLVYRATVEGSFERESQVAGFLNARGEFVRSVQAVERLLRDYPAESYVATATYALAQETYRRAPNASSDAKLKAAGITRVHLIDAAIDMLDHFVTAWPEDPADDQASFALATALLDLEKYDSVIERSEKYAARYPTSRLLDSFWYMIGYSHFELEHPNEALEMCQKVADATFPTQSGGTRPADNRWEAVYIMGQIHHSLGQAAKAISEYTKVKERFADATEAIKFFSRKEIALDEVTTIKPNEPKQLELRFRNVPETTIKIYRIDLMKFGLMQRNLDRITAINLAGIKPYHEETIALGDGKDFRDRTKKLTLPLKEEGAYLIVCRGESLYASGLALVSPLALLVQEDQESGRVRVSVKESIRDKFVSDVHVKVIGSANKDFSSGETDLRGLFIADDVRGTSTVIAALGEDQYAFYRGEVSLQNVAQQSDPAPSDPFGAPAAQQEMEQMQEAAKPSGKGALRDNLNRQNGVFQLEQQGNFEGLLNNDRKGVKSKEAY